MDDDLNLDDVDFDEVARRNDERVANQEVIPDDLVECESCKI